MGKKELTKEEWEALRPEIEELYHGKQRTVQWIVDELGRRNYKVTKKMFHYRFAGWNFKHKYRRQRTRIPGAVNTPPEQCHLHDALSAVGNYFDQFAEMDAWRWCSSQAEVEVQRVIATAHLAFETMSCNAHATWTELYALGSKVKSAMVSFNNPSTMHPRALTALIRLIVDVSPYNCMEAKALHIVRNMFGNVSGDLPPSHPVRLLCKLSYARAEAGEFLHEFLRQAEMKLYNRICQMAPEFVAQEQIYSARVLASLGFTKDADAQLAAVDSNFLCRADRHIQANFHRTIGFSKYHANSIDEAKFHLEKAVALFTVDGQDNSIPAMYSHISLANVCQKMNDLVGWQVHSEAALRAWASNRATNQGEGGIRLVRDLYHVYEIQGNSSAKCRLQEQYPMYFEETREHCAVKLSE